MIVKALSDFVSFTLELSTFESSLLSDLTSFLISLFFFLYILTLNLVMVTFSVGSHCFHHDSYYLHPS
jgi:hypothetical protein